MENFSIQKLSIKSQITVLAVNDEHSPEIVDKSLWPYHGIENIKDEWLQDIQLKEHKSLSPTINEACMNELKVNKI